MLILCCFLRQACYINGMFDDDNNLPQHGKKVLKDLSSLSVSELNYYLDELSQEIERTQAELKRKESYSSSVDSFFKN